MFLDVFRCFARFNFTYKFYLVCCCPPNLCRTLGILPGYIWNVGVDQNTVNIDVYLYISAHRSITLPSGESVEITIRSEMPWEGSVQIDIKIPASAKVVLRLPIAEWMIQTQVYISTLK